MAKITFNYFVKKCLVHTLGVFVGLLAIQFAQAAKLNENNYQAYFGDFNNDGLDGDIYFFNAPLFVLIHGDISVPLIIAGRDGFALYEGGNGAPEALTIPEDDLQNYTQAVVGQDVFFEDVNGDGVVDVRVLRPNNSVEIVLTGDTNAAFPSLYSGNMQEALLYAVPNLSSAATDPANDTLTGDVYYGALRGEHSVGPDGSFNYSIPIEVPPGINGMEPNLALTYSSNANDGYMGWGWRLSAGITTISRCSASLVRDGYISGIHPDDDFKFCLNGERLVHVGGSEYRTEVEKFKRITSVGSNLQKPSYWIVEYPNGIKEFVGQNTNAVNLDTQDDAYKWRLNTKIDQYGNAVKYNYSNDGMGEVFLNSIQYTVTANTSAVYQVSIHYRNKTSPILHYQVGEKERIERLIDAIDVSANGTPIRHYHMSYQESSNYEDPVGIQRINEIALCHSPNVVKDDHCPSIKFNWSDYDKSEYFSNPSPEEYKRFDEDIPAYLYSKEYPVTQSSGPIGHRSTKDQVGFYGVYPFVDDSDDPSNTEHGRTIVPRSIRGDFDGDGLMELILLANTGQRLSELNQYFTGPSSFSLHRAYIRDDGSFQELPFVPYNSWGPEIPAVPATPGVMDFNGDGIDDYYISVNTGNGWSWGNTSFEITVYLGNSDTQALELSEAYSISAPGTGFLLKDLNGDGLVDIYSPHVVVESELADGTTQLLGGGIYVRLNNGGGFDPVEIWGNSSDFAAYWSEMFVDEVAGIFSRVVHYPRSPVDVNGDGLPDIVKFYPGYGAEVALNRGSLAAGGFEFQGNWGLNEITTFGQIIEMNESPVMVTMPAVKYGDFNGDGMSDIAVVDKDGIYVSLSTGSSFATPVLWSTAFNVESIRGNPNRESNAPTRSWQLVDVNKDGKTDIVYENRNKFYSVLYSTGHPDLGFIEENNLNGVADSSRPEFHIDPTGNGILVPHSNEQREHPQHKLGPDKHKILSIVESNGASELTVNYEYLFGNNEVYEQTFSSTNLSVGRLTSRQFIGAGSLENPEVRRQFDPSNPASIHGFEIVKQLEIKLLGELSSSTSYRYYDLRSHGRGFGNLGFKKVDITETIPGHTHKIRTINEYYQEVADNESYLLNTLKKSTRCVFTGDIDECGAGAKIISEQKSNWKVRTFAANSPYYFPYIVENETKNYELNSTSTAPASTSVKRFYNDGVTNSCPGFTEISEADRTTGAIHYDDYGTPLDITEKHCDTFGVTSTRTENTNILNLISANGPWVLGLVQDPYIHTTIYDSSAQTTDSITRYSKFAFDSNGRVDTETREPNGSDNIWLRKDFDYNNYGSVEKITETVRSFTNDGINYTARDIEFNESYASNGVRTLITKNALDHSVTEVFNAEFGSLDSSTDANGIPVVMTYDALGRLKTQTSLGITSTFDYRKCDANCFAYNNDAAWYVQQKTTGATATRTYHDALGREVGKRWKGAFGDYNYVGTKYNDRGLTAFTTEPFRNSANEASLETALTYDVLGRVTQTSFPNGGVQTATYSVIDGAASVTTTDSLSNSRVQRFDALGREKTILDALNGLVTYWHDAQGNVEKIRVSNSDLSDALYHEIQFDLLGRKTKLIDPDIGEIDYNYNAFGHLATQLNDEGERICYEYDELDRNIRRIDNGTTSCGSSAIQTWTYDRPGELGLLASIEGTDTSDRAHKEVYNYTNGRLLPFEKINTIGGEEFTLTTHYDDFNRVKGITYPTGFTVENFYNSYGALTQAKNHHNTLPLWDTLSDDARGNLTGINYGNGATVTSAFKPDTGLIESRLASLNSTTLQHHTYDFDTEGNLRQRKDLRVSGNTITQNFCYDPLYRLTDANINSTCSDNNGSYSGTKYAYDIHGNLTRKDGVTDIVYGQAASNAGPHAISSANGSQYLYDNAGRMIGSPGERVIDYSAFGKPTYMGLNSGYQTQIIYGALQKRIERRDIDNGVLSTTVYIDKLYERIDSDDGREHRHYMGDWGVHVINRKEDSNYNVYMTRDHIGSLASKSDDRDSNSPTIKFHANEPWGRRQDQTWAGVSYDKLNGAALKDMTFATTRGFTDHEHLDGVGLIHMNGRVYDPVVGRFVSPDPWIQDPENSQSYNRYSYVWNNPLKYTDPTGEFSVFGSVTRVNAMDQGSLPRWTAKDAAIGVAIPVATTATALGCASVGAAGCLAALNAALLSDSSDPTDLLPSGKVKKLTETVDKMADVGDQAKKVENLKANSEAAGEIVDAKKIHDLPENSLKPDEAKDLQKIADKHNTQLDVIGSRAEGKGRNINDQSLPVTDGKGGKGPRSDIDIRINGQAEIDSKGQLSNDISKVGNGAGSVASQTGLESKPPVIIFRPHEELEVIQ